MRVCSLLPSATEIVADLGLIDSLVGVSEECAWQPEVKAKPRVTAARIDSATLSSEAIDGIVKASVGDGGSLYTVDADLIEELRPDILITQDLCTVCAVSSGDLASACPVGAEIISLDPGTLEEVAGSIELLGERFGVGARAREIGDDMHREIGAGGAAAVGLPPK